MADTEATDDILAGILATRWIAASGKFVDLASAIPDSRLESELVKGSRNCGEVLRHVAYWNRYIADSLNGNEPDDSANELSRDEFPDKATILAELQKTNEQIAVGMNRNDDGKPTATILMAFEHLSEHYGQLVVYARLLGITPPASQS